MVRIKVDSFLNFLFDTLMGHAKALKDTDGHVMGVVSHMDPEDWAGAQGNNSPDKDGCAHASLGNYRVVQNPTRRIAYQRK